MLPYLPSRVLKILKVLFAGLVLVYLVLYQQVLSGPDSAGPRFPPQKLPSYSCPVVNQRVPPVPPVGFSPNDTALTESRILILVESIYSRHGRLITQILNASKCAYKVETFSKNLPLLVTASHGRYSAILIENFYKYTNLAKWNRQLLDKYSQDYKAPIISFVPQRPTLLNTVKNSNLTFRQNQRAFNLRFSSSSIVPFIARPEAVLPIPSASSAEWALFEESPLYESVLIAEDEEGRRRAALLRDTGMKDGVEKLLFGHNITDWMVQLAFIDTLRYATKGRCGYSFLDRFIEIDVDDVFVGARGTRIQTEDVYALIQGQESLRKRISNFSFTLGFSGGYYLHGDDAEDEGEKMLIQEANRFHWFPHMFRHNHAQEYNESYLESQMTLNKKFAEDNGIPVPFRYAISPLHGGVFPVHVPLYNAWKKVWEVEVTATEEFPHLRPAGRRRGFIHRGIMVLPRQTCGLYTHTFMFHHYPGGTKELIKLIQGGDLFTTVLLNPVSVFMTHQQNYAFDRLGLFVFENLISFVQCWTRLSLHWEDPVSLAKRYFQLFPNERSPVWNNPCSDARHRAILSSSFNCENLTLPNLLIVGPQKTGTTALLSFLSLHPNVSITRNLPDSFEEVQFFSGQSYDKGLEWYASLFSPGEIVVDKSATYFDHSDAAERAAALLPSARILVVLHDPARRAYSWYNHLVARRDPSVEGLTMDDVLDGNSTTAKKIRQRCLSGGRYSHHLDRWLEHFPIGQFIFVDADELKEEPAGVVTMVAERLGLSPFDFAPHIKFNPRKGFYCKEVDGRSICLGASKGRVYPPMPTSLSSRLCGIFRADNIALQKVLRKHTIAFPRWLRPALTEC